MGVDSPGKTWDAVRIIKNMEVTNKVLAMRDCQSPVHGVLLGLAEFGEEQKVQVKGMVSFRVSGCVARPDDCGKGIRLSDVTPGCVIPWKNGTGMIWRVRSNKVGTQYVDVLL